MLILTRRIGETLIIGNDGEITATILGVRGNQVRIGISAPKDVPVHREEIFRRIHDHTSADETGASGTEAPQNPEESKS